MRTFLFAAGLVLACTCVGADAQSEDALPEAPESQIGYPSVAEALEALQKNADVQIKVENGWTIAIDKSISSIWSFAPETDAAYPAVVKRTVVERDGAAFLDMRVLCQASKAACDTFVRQFQALNDRLRESMQKRR